MTILLRTLRFLCFSFDLILIVLITDLLMSWWFSYKLLNCWPCNIIKVLPSVFLRSFDDLFDPANLETLTWTIFLKLKCSCWSLCCGRLTVTRPSSKETLRLSLRRNTIMAHGTWNPPPMNHQYVSYSLATIWGIPSPGVRHFVG